MQTMAQKRDAIRTEQERKNAAWRAGWDREKTKVMEPSYTGRNGYAD